jgi:hypothetical protein
MLSLNHLYISYPISPLNGFIFELLLAGKQILSAFNYLIEYLNTDLLSFIPSSITIGFKDYFEGFNF